MDSKEMLFCGNSGPKLRSDCRIGFLTTKEGGRKIDLKSKVKVMFGEEILRLANEVLDFYNIEHCEMQIEDSGALNFVLAARMEAAIRKATGSEQEFLLPALEKNLKESPKDRFRFSRLYLPGNTPHLFINASIHNPDGLILDLEDAVAYDKKYEASFIVRNALRIIDYGNAERMVRINQIPRGLDDLPFIVNHGVNLILVPKCESADQIKAVNDKIAEISENKDWKIWLMPIIESALGVMKAYEIASAADNVVALAIGLEDYTADMGTQRTREGKESFIARNNLAMACKAAGILAIDSVYSDVDDSEGLINAIKESKSIGFTGMGCIHPRQIRLIHEYYGPEEAEIEKSKKIVLAFDDATAKGLGVVSLGSKMIDPPVVKRALTTIDIAISTGKLSSNWKEEAE
jgi:citrate lyase subunit beta/citryl-CoA lyase